MIDPLTLKQRIQKDMLEARRAQDKLHLSAIQSIWAAIKQVEVDERIEVDEERIYQLLDKMLKQRRDSIDQYTQANRNDLVAQEQLEEKVIQSYLPEPLAEGDIDRLLSEVIEQVHACSIRDMGKVMAELKARLQGRADITVVSQKVKQRLT